MDGLLAKGQAADHIDRATLEAGLPDVRRSPKDAGVVELVVRRPAENEREILEQAELDVGVGLVGPGSGPCSHPDPRIATVMTPASAEPSVRMLKPTLLAW